MWLVISNDKENESFTVFYKTNHLKEETIDTGVWVDEITEPPSKEGKKTELKFDGKKLYYEYVDIPMTETEILNKRLASTEEMLMQLMLEGGV